MTFRFALSCLLLLSCLHLAAQNQGEPDNVLFANFGYTFIPKADKPGSSSASGFFVPTLGLDYFRSLNEKWKLGLMLDYELKDYLIVSEELERNNPLLIVASAKYAVWPDWGLLFGAGIEIEPEKDLPLFRLGIERSFSLGNQWELAIPLLFDYKKDYTTWSLSLGIGKAF